ncbi:CDP-glycerol glycerophosphotransferase, TagB/SpsB family [Cyclonatronum proteinivorum]|uniref:CDP-glycerol glycerophosphotransferase, TagB/SpsB family n=1 Tax=Cyclonatronum proteinivorum TaxID=1457365 RepID=A0A345UJ63_9BACT|nr:CDP-glycerol glycerophosphotransferase family protein [Cyclonatronum proteinivorum]AXJ00515.1 CDP-glycerol glycerophosphotransferase, TagB/SpsB family [Cyclonatronum proteinivorum]
MSKSSRTAYPLQWFFGLLSAWFIPASKPNAHKVVLTSFHGDGYRGNTRIIFEALQDHPEIEAVWLTRNPDLCATLQQKFGHSKAALQHSWRGLRELGEARALFLTHGTSDFAFLKLPRHAAIIQTYHGLPTKRGEYMRPGTDKPPGAVHRKVLEYRFQPITHFLSSSETVSEVFSKRFGLPAGRFRETGFPMYESLVKRSGDEKSAVLQMLGIPETPHEKPAKIVLYAPTYRRRTRTRWLPFEALNTEKLSDFLEHENAWLCFRPHPNDFNPPKKLLECSPRILLSGQRVVEQTEVLVAASDVIVTDYSSVYLEGLLRDIPPLFIPYDRDSYERGMPLPYDEFTPGPHIHSMDDFLSALSEALSGGAKYREARERVRNMFFRHQGDDATARVIKLLEEEILR